MMKVVWLDEAEADFDELIDYLLRRGAAMAAGRIAAVIQQRVAMLADYPGLGRPGRSPGTRELVIARTPYIVAYRVDERGGVVNILRVRHGAQRWTDDRSP
jgi:toxin ParE1/3/4